MEMFIRSAGSKYRGELVTERTGSLGGRVGLLRVSSSSSAGWYTIGVKRLGGRARWVSFCQFIRWSR